MPALDAPLDLYREYFTTLETRSQSANAIGLGPSLGT
jgi:hypothetical protein